MKFVMLNWQREKGSGLMMFVMLNWPRDKRPGLMFVLWSSAVRWLLEWGREKGYVY